MGITDLIDGVKQQMEGLAKAGLFNLWIGGKPVPAGRPRVSKWGVYYAPAYTRWVKESWQYVSDLDTVPTDRPIAVLIEIICPAPKTTKSCAPMGDVDNFSKGPLDLLTKTERVWLDDRQVTFLATAKRWASGTEEVGFKLWWCELEG